MTSTIGSDVPLSTIFPKSQCSSEPEQQRSKDKHSEVIRIELLLLNHMHDIRTVVCNITIRKKIECPPQQSEKLSRSKVQKKAAFCGMEEMATAGKLKHNRKWRKSLLGPNCILIFIITDAHRTEFNPIVYIKI